MSDDAHLKNLVLDISMETQDNFDIIHKLECLNRHPDGVAVAPNTNLPYLRERERALVYSLCTRCGALDMSYRESCRLAWYLLHSPNMFDAPDISPEMSLWGGCRLVWEVVYSRYMSCEMSNMITSMTLREVYKCALERYTHRACLMSTDQNALDISTGYVVMLYIAN